MAKVYIYADETYRSEINPQREDDDQFPSLYLPVEVPDALLAAYQDAAQTERSLRRYIIDTYGESEQNPNHEQEWAEFLARSKNEAGDD